MPAFSPQFQRVFIFDPDKARSTASVFFDSYTPEGNDMPCYVFLLSEIKTTDHEKNQYLIREIQNRLFRYFSNSPERMTEMHFEEGLHSINKLIPTLLEDRPPDFLENVTLIAGTVYGNVVHFSQAGPATMMYMHGGKIIDIADHGVNKHINPLKVFQEVGSGKIESSDSLFIGTTNFLDYFSQEKIRRLIEENSDTDIAKKFDEHLSQAPLAASFAAMHIAVQPGTVTSVDEYIRQSQEQPPRQAHMRSIEELIERETATDEILAPKFLPLVYKKTMTSLRAIRLAIKKHIFRKPTRVSPITIEKEEQNAERIRELYLRKMHHASKQQSMRKISKTASSSIQKSSDAIRSMFRRMQAMVRKEKSEELAPAVRPSTLRSANILRWFKELSNKRKILFAVLVLIVVIFAQSMVIIAERDQAAEQNETVTTATNQINDYLADIDASFLYGDDNRVRTTIAEIERLLQELPDTDATKETRQKAMDAISSASNRLQRIRLVENPTLVTDLANQADGGSIQSTIRAGDWLYTIVPEKNIIIRTSPTSGESISIPGKASSTPQYITALDATAVIVNQDLSVVEIRPNAESVTTMTSSFSADTNIAAVATYLSRLYSIDISQNQIIRSNRSASGYGTPSLWLSENTLPTGATSIAIDGTIYIGFDNGTVKKFEQGSETSFSLGVLDEPIQRISHIWTDDESKSIYVMDTASKRIVRYAKDGALEEQIQFPTLASLSSFTVDEKNNTIFIISGSSIYKTEITSQQ